MNVSDTGQAMELGLLGGFELRIGDVPVHILPTAQRLLAYLTLHEHPVPRHAVAAGLWPGASAQRAAACLRSTLWRLTKPPHRMIEADPDVLRLAPRVQVDLIAMRRFAAAFARSPDTRPDAALVAQLTADLLPGWLEPWALAERDWFRQLRLRALETLSERFRISGDNFRAHETAVAAVQGDPLRESAHRRLIEVHLADGNPAEAVRQYTGYRARLWSELGLTPSPEICELVGAMVPAGDVRYGRSRS